MSTPDVRVRLSPEGINEVIFALRQLQAESKKTQQSAGDGINVFNTALKELKSLLPTIGLGAAVAGFAALSKEALDTAAHTGKIQESFGGTVEQISALTLAFKENQSDQDGLQTALQKTAKFMQDLKAGSATAIESLRAIGLSSADVVNLPLPQAFALIAQKIAAIPPDGGRAGAAISVLGKQARDLLPALVAVGTEGIDPFIDKARDLGVLVDGDLVKAAQRAKDALDLVKIEAEGLATQFVSGLAPAVASAFDAFNKAVTGDGINGMQKFGQGVGLVVKGVIGAFVLMGQVIGAVFADLVNGVTEVVDVAKALISGLVSGDFAGVGKAIDAADAREKAIGDSLKQDINKLTTDLTSEPTKAAAAAAGNGGGGNDVLDQQAKRAAEARAAAQKAALDAELKLQQENIKAKQAQNQEDYDSSLISLQQYYNKRSALTKQQVATEVSTLQLQRDVLTKQLAAAPAQGGPEFEADRIKIESQIATIDSQINATRAAGARELQALNKDRLAAGEALAKQEAQLSSELDDLESKRHEVFQRNLDAELVDVADLGTRAGQSIDQIQAAQDRLTKARTASFNFDEASRAGNNGLNSFQDQADQIARDQQAGILSQVEGEQKLIDLEKERLEVLQQLSAELTAAAEATGNQDQIDKAKQFAASIDGIRASLQAATDFGKQFRSGVVDSFEQGVSSMLQNADKLTSIGDAFRQLGLSIAQTLEKIAADILAKQAILALVKAFTGFGGSSSAGSFSGGTDVGSGVGAALAFRGGHVTAMAEGGDVRGRELAVPGPDKIPIMAQAGEFMMRKARVVEPGALSFLRAWNAGHVTLAQAMSVRHFATGGEVTPAVGIPGAPGGTTNQLQRNIRVVNVLHPDLVTDALASAAGEQTILNVVARNSTSIKRILKG